GAADFSGGIAARYLRVFWLLAISHAFSLTCLLLFGLTFHEVLPHGNVLVWGLCAGVAGGLALLCFYQALALGDMGATAAISGLLSAALPVLFTLATIGAPTRRQLLGFGLAAAAIWLISTQPEKSKSGIARTPLARRRLSFAIISGIGFGIFFIALRLANSGGLIWPLAASRVASMSVAVCGGLVFSRKHFTVSRNEASSPDAIRARAPWKEGVALAVLAAICDTAGNVLFVAATRTGRLDIAAVLASLYPASTILLAAWLLNERTSARQAAGMAAALVAVALIS
ncbi:MAG TPA: EamA family transporter, partial [Acidobacteriaceae bacterium]|nr:EamA family transporter [Acidobacteriaceae bacterium]